MSYAQLSPRARRRIKDGIGRSAQLLQTAFHARRPRVIVLCYHSVGTSRSYLTVPEQQLVSQLDFLRDEEYSFLAFGDLVQRLYDGNIPTVPTAVITFDDGFADVYNVAWPILVQANVPATIFITTGLLNQEPAVLQRFDKIVGFRERYLSPSALCDLSKAGCEIGAHTHSHRNLARLTRDAATDELQRSRGILEETLGLTVDLFAYPFGKRGLHYTAATIEVAQTCAYVGGGAISSRSVRPGDLNHMMEIPRFAIERGEKLSSFEAKVRGQLDWLGAYQQRAPRFIKALVSPEDRR
jgi:peptidoglycan/xylan/chitin deacetylase (PgdA/CDA1 family)